MDDRAVSGRVPLAIAEQVRNLCRRGYRRCGFDEVARGCVAAGCPSTVKHVKTGGVYEHVGQAVVKTDGPLTDMALVEVYRSADTVERLYVRPAAEFAERFVPASRTEALPPAPAREPLFWYRPRSDGRGFDGPVPNDLLEPVRKRSGAWVPLYPGAAPAGPGIFQKATS